MNVASKRKVGRVFGAVALAATTTLCTAGPAFAATRSVTSTINVRTQNANGSWGAYRMGATRQSAEGQGFSVALPSTMTATDAQRLQRATVQVTPFANGVYNVSVPLKTTKSTTGRVNVSVQQENGSFKTYSGAVVESVPVGLTETAVIARGDSVYQDATALVRSGATTSVTLYRRQVMATHQVYACYQNADGSFAAPQLVKTLQGVKGQRGSFSLPATDTFAGVGGSFTFGSGQTIVNVSRKTFPVTVKAGTGIARVVGAGSFRVGQTVSISAAPASGYAFAQWTATAGTIANPKAATTTFVMPAGATTVTATASQPTFQLAVNGASGSGSYKANQQVTISAATRTGFTFASWSAPSNVRIANLRSARTTLTMPAANASVTANYTANKYTVAFNGNGGSGVPRNIVATYGASFRLPTASPVRAGYTFDCWTANANGSGATYRPGQAVSNLTAAANGCVTLYARWIANRSVIRTVAATAGFASITPASVTVPAGQTMTITMRLASGYKFAGCSAVVSGSSERVNPTCRVSGTTVTMTVKAPLSGNVTISARATR